MRPVFQTKMHNPKEGIRGNCLAAAIASVMELSIEDVPAFEDSYDLPDDQWQELLWDFLHAKKYDLEQWDDAPNGYAIAHGVGARGVRHSVVVLDGVFAHDPHPSRGFLESVDYYWRLFPMTCARCNAQELTCNDLCYACWIENQ